MKIRNNHDDDDVVKSTLSELVLFLVFMSLILLGQIQASNFIDAEGEHSIPLDHYFPIIILSDDRGYRFASDSSYPDQAFVDNLLGIEVPRIENLLRRYQGRISTIEVIGHTDDVPVPQRSTSNLDRMATLLLETDAIDIDGSTVLDILTHSDNAGLGLARAAVVAGLLRHGLSDEFSEVQILPYSASHLVGTNGRLQTGAITGYEDNDRRRIEIRLR